MTYNIDIKTKHFNTTLVIIKQEGYEKEEN